MMKLFVVTDIHGFYDEMQSALTKAGFDHNNPNHIFISCGDLFDRGSQPYECLKFVMSLDPKRRILIRGNHEDLMEQAIQRGCFADYDKSNGTMDTALALTTELNEHDALIHLRLHPLYNAYIQSTQNWAEIDDYIFVHGWIPSNLKMIKNGWKYCYTQYTYLSNWREASNADWEEAKWINGMEAWSDGVREPNKTIVCGHWHTSWGHCYLHQMGREFSENSIFTPFEDEGIIALDACTAYSHQVNCVVIDI